MRGSGGSRSSSSSTSRSAAASPRDISARPPDDARLERRLTGIYSQIAGLDQVRVRVGDGVAHLSGTTETVSLENRAASLAERLEGVVFVDNQIAQPTDLGSRFAPTVHKLARLGRGALSALPQALGALVVFLPFLFLSRVLRRWRQPLHRLGVRRLTGHLVRSSLRLGLLLAGLLLALDIVGLLPSLATVIGTLGLLAVVAGLAFRDWVQNYLPGLMLGFHPPFAAGDLVQIGEREGRVVRITPRATALITTDGEEVLIPNALLFREALTNLSHHRQRRLRFTMSLSPRADLGAAQDLGRTALLELDGVMNDPPPFMRTRSLERDSVEVEFFAWIDQDRVNFRTLKSRAQRAVFELLRRRGVPLPEDVLTVHVPPPAARPDAHAETREDDAEDRDRRFLDEQVGRARSAATERDLLEEGHSR